MNQRLKLATAVIALTAVSFCHGAAAAGHPFDGRWSISLVCPDTNGKKGFVKGYEYAFEASIREGAVQGQYGAPGQPASVVLAGQVSDDGTIEIAAEGNSGPSEYTVGKIAKGTHYAYTMQGKLAGSSGQAMRRELRPYTATFNRNVQPQLVLQAGNGA